MSKGTFDHLSAEERAVVGDPEDYDWDLPISAPPARRDRSQFSMRVEPKLYGELVDVAQTRGVRFSEVVREALEQYVGRRQPVTATAAYSVGFGYAIIGPEKASPWTSTRGTDPRDLHTELDQDERNAVTGWVPAY